MIVSPKDCLSTHGASGYMPGSTWGGLDTDNPYIVCGACGTKIYDPPHSGYATLSDGRTVKTWGEYLGNHPNSNLIYNDRIKRAQEIKIEDGIAIVIVFGILIGIIIFLFYI